MQPSADLQQSVVDAPEYVLLQLATFGNDVDGPASPSGSQ
jgi:hypothetical protein